MRSDPARLDDEVQERKSSWLERTVLRSQGLGVACGLSTVVLLAIGSFVLTATREGPSAGIGMDDLRGFFTRPSPVHLWLYLLIPLFVLYSLNTLLATLHSLARKIEARVRAPSAYGPVFFHLGFLLALLAHLMNGLLGGARPPMILAGDFQRLGEGDPREARVVEIAREDLPSGMPKTLRARIEIRRNGQVENTWIGYNEPLSSGLGSDLRLLGDAGEIAAAKLRIGAEQCTVPDGASCNLGKHHVIVRRIGDMGDASVLLATVEVDKGEVRHLVPGRFVTLEDGSTLSLDGFERQPAVEIKGRRAPGVPVALAASILLTIGVLLMARRLGPRIGDARNGA